MKRASIFVSVALLVACYRSDAQVYWVVETNRAHKFAIIRLYDDKNQLIWEEKKEGVYLDVSKNRQRKRLDALVNKYTRHNSPMSRKKLQRKISTQAF